MTEYPTTMDRTLRRNIKDKLTECNISHHASIILDDVFGRKLDTVFQEGLVDCHDSDDYEAKLQESWRKFEEAGADKFINLFMANKAGTIRTTILRSVRGLGNPPSTNASESINALLKSKVEYKKHQLPEFIDKVRELVDESVLLWTVVNGS